MLPFVVIISVLVLGPVVYRLWLHPLSKVPGPWTAAISSVFLYVICYRGNEGTVLRQYHQKHHTKVLRVGPNSVSISDSSAIRDIYISGGGFPKDDRYQNFNMGPVRSIFSSIDTAYRDLRAKAVAPLFSPANLRKESGPDGAIGRHVTDFVRQLSAFRDAGIRTDILDLCAKQSIDVVSAFLLGQPYGGLSEHAHLSLADRQRHDAKLSANDFIHAIVGFARFSLLPNRLFKLAYGISQRVGHDVKVDQSMAKIMSYIGQIMAAMDTGQKTNYYQDRLVAAGVSKFEAGVQSEAILFAGGDSTAVMQATILFHLTRNIPARSRLLHEIRAGSKKDTDQPFLRACIKEGLRLGMANPTRLTRVVPPGSSLTVDGIKIPSGAIVGCAAYTLHHDPAIFPEPFAFRPERWMDDGSDAGLRRPDMERSLFAFGAGLRACIGKNLAMHQIQETVMAVVDSEILEGAQTCEEQIEVIQWFNGDVKGHRIEIEW